MSAHFTKGPWVYKWFGGPQIGGGRSGATAICTLWGSFRTGEPTRQERANRDLICAAPNLYFDLADIVAQLNGDGMVIASTVMRAQHTLRKARGIASEVSSVGGAL